MFYRQISIVLPTIMAAYIKNVSTPTAYSETEILLADYSLLLTILRPSIFFFEV